MPLGRANLLEGIRVVELAEGIAIPYAGRLLRALGADVVKIERARVGDQARRVGPFAAGGGSLSFYYLNAGKRSLTLDVTQAKARELAIKLLAGADIFVCDRSIAAMQSWNLPYESLAELFPTLVIVVVRPFGLTGPWATLRSRSLNVYHASGMGFITRRRNAQGDTGPPMHAPGHQPDYFAALHAASAALTGLFQRRVSGCGQLIELSQQELLMALIYNPLAYYYYEDRVIGLGKEPQQAGGILPCKDGYVLISSNAERFWEGLIKLMGDPEWAEGGWWRDAENRFMNRDFLNGHLLEWLKEKNMREVNELCQNAHLPVGVLNTPKDVAEDRQLLARGFFEEWDERDLGPVKYPGLSFRLKDDSETVGADAPRLGEHTSEILEGLGLSQKEILALQQAGVV